ncbi:MAG: hypothetical protein JSS09_02495 [Verrucomicrobia bacterium]|nr:hypothetical protein [Verrucomicrobiota bacterium]
MRQKIYTSTSFKVLSTIQSVESKLKQPVSKQIFDKLFILLEKAQKECHDEDLLAKIICLYRKIIDRYVDTEVQKIVTLSTKPKHNVKALTQKIADVKLYGLSKENFFLLRKVERKIQKSQIPKDKPPLSPFIDIEWIEELFSLASQLYFNEEEKVKKSYQTIPKEIQKSLLQHLSSLQKTLFEDTFSMILAFFATAHELAETPLTNYPTSQEIHLFFAEEQNVKKADHSQHWNYKIN